MKWNPFIEGRLIGGSRSFYNGKYQAIKREERNEEGEVVLVCLSIRREDRKPIFDWRDVQRIKNELIGPEEEAIQLFPAESRLVDTSNQFWLWCFPGKRFPVGFSGRAVSENVSIRIDGGQSSV